MTPRERLDALLPWYAANARDLPWRRDPTPYHVLLSELMLQQTRVDTVIPYFGRFLAQWPTIEALATADEQDVLRAWAGLGYYRRARSLLACARAAVAAGGLPDTAEALAELPGIGPYTAGAIASIAWGRRSPLVDGNVERVISRWDGLHADPRSPAGRRAIWAAVGALHDALRDAEAPGALNQALMELGALVCTPRAPRCDRCPVADRCAARAAGDAESLPKLAPKAAPVAVTAAYGLARCDGALVVGRRPEGLLGGLWEPIGVELAEGDAPEAALQAAFRERAGLEVVVGPELGVVRHTFTHRRLVARVFAVTAGGPPGAASWYDEVRAVRDPAALPLSTLARKLLAWA